MSNTLLCEVCNLGKEGRHLDVLDVVAQALKVVVRDTKQRTMSARRAQLLIAAIFAIDFDRSMTTAKNAASP